MKKIKKKFLLKLINITCVLVCIVSILCLSVSASTNMAEWNKMCGGGTLKFTDEGVSCDLKNDGAMTLYKYNNGLVDFENFSCKFRLNFGENKKSFFAFTLSDKAAMSGSIGLLILIQPKTTSMFNLSVQVLNRGVGVEPKSQNMYGSNYFNRDMELTGKYNVDGTYTLSINGFGSYTFSIPEEYSIPDKLKDGAYFSFGGSLDKEDVPRTIVLYETGDYSFYDSTYDGLRKSQRFIFSGLLDIFSFLTVSPVLCLGIALFAVGGAIGLYKRLT